MEKLRSHSATVRKTIQHISQTYKQEFIWKVLVAFRFIKCWQRTAASLSWHLSLWNPRLKQRISVALLPFKHTLIFCTIVIRVPLPLMINNVVQMLRWKLLSLNVVLFLCCKFKLCSQVSVKLPMAPEIADVKEFLFCGSSPSFFPFETNMREIKTA